jgi:hypothetical protein
MDRRGFLRTTARAGSALLIVPAASLVGCNASGGPAAPYEAVDGLRFTSDPAGIHTHDFLIAMVDLEMPAEGGIQGATTVSLGHKHVVRLTKEDLAHIGAGVTVNKATSIVDGHTHNFKFSLATAQNPPSTASPTSTASPDGSSSSGD